MAKKKPPFYLIEEKAWESNEVDETVPGGAAFLYTETGGGAPCLLCITEAAAVEECERFERNLWSERNPFCFGKEWDDWTSLDGGRLHDWLLDAGIEPPVWRDDLADASNWRVWYAESASRWNELQQRKLWEGLDRVRFFRVVELWE